MITKEERDRIKTRYDHANAARQAFDPRRYQRGGGYGSEEYAAFGYPTNEELGEVEFYDFMMERPSHLFAYYDKNFKFITGFMGKRLGRIVWDGKPHRVGWGAGGKIVRVRVEGVNGVSYHGTCNLESGTYCKLKRVGYKGKGAWKKPHYLFNSKKRGAPVRYKDNSGAQDEIVRAWYRGRSKKIALTTPMGGGTKRHRYSTDGTSLWVWGNLVAKKVGPSMAVITDANWQTLLTRNVLNEVLSVMGVGHHLRQEKGDWYMGHKLRPWQGGALIVERNYVIPMDKRTVSGFASESPSHIASDLRAIVQRWKVGEERRGQEERALDDARRQRAERLAPSVERRRAARQARWEAQSEAARREREGREGRYLFNRKGMKSRKNPIVPRRYGSIYDRISFGMSDEAGDEKVRKIVIAALEGGRSGKDPVEIRKFLVRSFTTLSKKYPEINHPEIGVVVMAYVGEYLHGEEPVA
jgi:hypothetical protein